MWHNNDKITEIYNSFIEGGMKFPCECPACKSESAHVYIHSHDAHHCGIWVWCSKCGAYSHMSGQTPKRWENPAFIDKSELCSEPDYLETKAAEIDGWVNTLIPNKKTKAESPFVIEDRFNAKLKTEMQGIPAGTEGVIVVKNDFKTVTVQFIYEEGKVIELLLSQEELLQAVEVL